MDLQAYYKKNLGWGNGFQAREVFNFLMDASDFCKGGVVLDAGAGHQRYRPFFERSLYLTQEFDSGIQMKGMNSISYDLIGPLYEKIPLKDNCLEGVLSTSVIEHLRYPEGFFKEAHRVLKPGGKLFINVPFVHNEHEIPYDFNRPTRYGIERWLVDAGFKDYIIRPSSSSTETVCELMWSGISQDIGYGIEKKNRLHGKALKAFYFIVFKFICWLSRLAVDRGPLPETNLPIGWIAIGTKSGILSKKPMLLSRENFLKENRL
jgi:SAM-dependent methyltransferase